MTGDEYTHLFKVLVVGSSGVGKTCLLLRYTDSIYKETYGSTIGVDFKMKSVDLDGARVKLQLWDTAGQERFRTITSSYYRNAHGIILVFDITDRDTFVDLKGWITEILSNTTGPVVLLLLGNKIDEKEKLGSAASSKEVSELLESFASSKLAILGYREVSAKTGSGVSQAFEEITRGIKKVLPQMAASQRKPIRLETEDSISGWCCIG